MIILGAPVEVNKTQGKILPRQWRHNIATECCKSIPIRFPRPKSPPSWLNKSSFLILLVFVLFGLPPPLHFVLISQFAFRHNYCEISTTLWSFSSRLSDPSFSHHFRQDPHAPAFNFSRHFVLDQWVAFCDFAISGGAFWRRLPTTTAGATFVKSAVAGSISAHYRHCPQPATFLSAAPSLKITWREEVMLWNGRKREVGALRMLRGVIAGCQCSNEGLARQRCEAEVVRCGYHQSGSDTVGTWAGINVRNVSNFGTVAVVVLYLCVLW